MPRNKKDQVEEVVETVVENLEFTVADPQVLRPKELPLIITPNTGVWSNDNQAKFASVLNAYAYKNPEKWSTKKVELLKQLSEIGQNPSAYTKYAGNQTNISFGNKLIQSAEDNA